MASDYIMNQNQYTRLAVNLNKVIRGPSSYVLDDFPMTGPMRVQLSEKALKILDKIVVMSLSTRSEGSTYLYCPSIGCWSDIRGPIAMREIADVLDMENVSVNFAVATEPYIEQCERYSNICNEIPRSLCVSTMRLAMYLGRRMIGDEEVLREKDLDRIELSPISGIVVPIVQYCSRRIGGLCFRPLQINTIPESLRLTPGLSPGMSILSNTFSERDLLALRWVVGNALIDKTNRPRILYLYGSEGGEGKSVAINTISTNLPGLTTAMRRDLLGIHKATLKDEEKSDLLNYRIVTYGDVQLESGKLNTAIWRDLGSGDRTSVGKGTGTLNATCLAAGNHLWYQKGFLLKRWFARRTVVLVLRRPAIGLSLPKASFTDLECAKFYIECVRTRLLYPDVPLSPVSVVIGIFGHRSGVATRGVVWDDNATFLQCLAGTYSISHASQVPMSKLLDLVGSMSYLAIVSRYGMTAIANIRPSIS